MKIRKFYCPKCEYQIIEEYISEDDELFCQNCLAWSKIVYVDGEPMLKFLKYDGE
jgi:hypothetical protein